MFVACLSVLMGCTSTEQDEVMPNPMEAQIDSLFHQFDRLDSPGYAIGISKGGQTVYKRSYGAANLDYNIPIATNSAFSIASVSKQFTAACIALLILEEKLSLETPVAEFIPELGKYPDTIRIKHLIYNTSGIIDCYKLDRESGTSWVTFNYFDIKECISTSLAEEKLQFTPGEKWDYCNVNFMLLTKVVEQVSGQSFSSFIWNRLFEPLGMTNTLVNDDMTQVIKNRVTPYSPRSTLYLEAYAAEGFELKEEGNYIKHHRNAPHYGGSGVVSTIDDLLKWTSSLETQQFGGAPFYDLMHTTLRFEHERDNQAFGLYFSRYQDRRTVAWEGGDYGISTQILRFPDEQVSIIVLSNLDSGNAPEKAKEIADVLIDHGVIQ